MPASSFSISDHTVSSTDAKLVSWLQSALQTSGMSQSELGRRLSVSLGRPIERCTIHSMVAGYRKLKADEFLEIAEICRVPLLHLDHGRPQTPALHRGVESELQSANLFGEMDGPV